uniref:PRC-barrel domain-containing protein n=1 Tax=uncultured Corynebacterium sp. TaxID=159447 RepID=UPI002624AF3E
MITEKNLKDLFAATAYDKDGDKLGAVKEIFVDDETGQPAFAEVGHGLFGMSSSLVPMRGHRFSGEDLQLAFSKDRIKDAPDVGTDEHLTREDQQRVWDHYQLSDTEDTERYRAEERAARDVDHRREAAAGAGAGAGVAGNRPGHVADDRERV